MNINVTKTFLPPMEEYQAILQRAWDKRWITNRGELVVELEEKLVEFLGVPRLTATMNGTVPIRIAIKALGLSGDVITTPFSYVATTAAVVWENCNPVFVDIHPEYLTIDETKIEAAITPQTKAILATHVYGNPCNIEEIDRIAKKHGLKVIYDAAHCFGVKYKGQSIFNYGDVSTCSFHGTKIFQTGEGGCFVANNEELHEVMFYMHKFGHDGPENFRGLGVNAKMSELNAAMGLAMLGHLEEIFNGRRRAVEWYDQKLAGSTLTTLKLRADTEWNYHYYPVIFDSESTLLKKVEELNALGIYPRRYFYPSLNNLPYVESVSMPVSEDISSRVLCLPLYHDISESDVERISRVIIE